MSLAEHIEALTAPTSKECKYVRFLARLREQDDPVKVDEFEGLVAAHRISGSKAAKALTAELGDTISADTIQKHYRGDCGCTR